MAGAAGDPRPGVSEQVMTARRMEQSVAVAVRSFRPSAAGDAKRGWRVEEKTLAFSQECGLDR